MECTAGLLNGLNICFLVCSQSHVPSKKLFPHLSSLGFLWRPEELQHLHPHTLPSWVDSSALASVTVQEWTCDSKKVGEDPSPENFWLELTRKCSLSCIRLCDFWHSRHGRVKPAEWEDRRERDRDGTARGGRKRKGEEGKGAGRGGGGKVVLESLV